MKNLWLHGIYLTVVGVLCFQLWSKTISYQSIMNHMTGVLKENNALLNDITTYNFAIIEKQSSTNPKVYEHLANQAKNIVQSSKSFTETLSKKLFNFEKGGKVNFTEIRDSLAACSQKYNSAIDKQDSILIKKLFTPKLLENDTFWDHFKTNEKTYLALLKNYVRLDEVILQNYILDRFGCIKVEIKLDNYRVLSHNNLLK